MSEKVATGTPKKTRPELSNTVKSLQFAWFVGHVVTLISVFFYALTYIKIGAGWYKFWYQLALVGIIESFGILIVQLVQKNGVNVSVLLKDDNSQYLVLASAFILLRPYVLLVLLPFALFSLFHVLAYVNGYLLPVFSLEDHPISKTINNFVSTNNVKSIQLASILEIYSFAWLFVRVITFRKRSLTPFLLYAIFIKIRFEKSVFTRNYVKSIEVQIDSLVNQHASTVPAVKNSWIQVKNILRRVGGIYVVNDYTKEKAT